MQLTPMLARRFTIAGIQIFGGLYGFSVSAPALINTDDWLWRVVTLAICSFYLACFVAGVLLLRDNDLGASLSMYLQVPQVVLLYSDTLTYQLYAGFSATISLVTPFSFHLGFETGAKAWFHVALDVEHVTFGINLFAVVTLWQLLSYLDAKDALRQPVPAPTLGGMV